MNCLFYEQIKIKNTGFVELRSDNLKL